MALDDWAAPERLVFEESQHFIRMLAAVGFDSPPEHQGHTVIGHIFVVPDQGADQGKGVTSGQPFGGGGELIAHLQVVLLNSEADQRLRRGGCDGLAIAEETRRPEADYPALLLGNFMTGGGFLNSRLATRIRRQDGLSYGVGSFLHVSSLDQDSQFGSYAIYAPQNAERLVAAYLDELAKVREGGFEPTEIAEAKQGWLQRNQLSRANDRELVRTLTALEYLGRTLAWDETLEREVAALTNDEIVAAMRKYIAPDKISFFQAGDFAKVKAQAAAPAPSGGGQ